MTKIYQICFQGFLGAVIGTFVWATIVSVIVGVIIYTSGYIKFEVFGAGGIEPMIPILLGMIWGILQGLFTGMILRAFAASGMILGGLIGFMVGEILLLSIYVVFNLLMLLYGEGFFETISSSDDSNFLPFSILIFLPSVLTGALISKIFTISTITKYLNN